MKKANAAGSMQDPKANTAGSDGKCRPLGRLLKGLERVEISR